MTSSWTHLSLGRPKWANKKQKNLFCWTHVEQKKEVEQKIHYHGKHRENEFTLGYFNTKIDK